MVTYCHDAKEERTTMMLRLFAMALLALGSASAFAPISSSPRTTTSLEMKNNGGKMAAASMLTGAFLAANAVFFADAAIAAPVADFGSPEMMLAGRSGGRGGGRASRAPARRAAPRAAAPSSTTRIERTTVVQPVYSSPSVVVSPFGYNPLGGFGFGYGLGAVNSIGNEFRDARQESEIQQSRAELDQARAREAELDARIRQLEAAQAVKQ